ncbi:hypothetical protein BJ742DRAFT_905385, partial [Cladochytrium replicatum]
RREITPIPVPEFEDLDPEYLLAYTPVHRSGVVRQRRVRSQSENGEQEERTQRLRLTSPTEYTWNDFDERLIYSSRNGSPAANTHGSVGLSLPGGSLMEDTWQSFMRKHHRKDGSGIVLKDLDIPDWSAFPIADEVTKERMLNMLSVVSDMVPNRVGGSSNEEIWSGSPMFSTAESIDAGGVAPSVVRMVLQFELETFLLQRDGTTGFLALAFRPITEVMKDQTRLKHLGAFIGYIVSHIILDDPIHLAIFAYFGGEVIKLLLAHQELRVGWSEVRSNFYNQICDAAENNNNLLVGSFWQNISLLVEHVSQRQQHGLSALTT